MDTEKTDGRHQATKDEKKQYVRPELIVHGSVAARTNGGGNPGSDGISGLS
jgi:hypothetical protein